MKRAALVALTGAAACSGSDAPPSGLTLASSYDVVAVVRVFPDGLSPASLETVALSFGSVRVSAGRALAEAQRKGLGAAGVPLSGTFDEETKNLQFDVAQGALTSTRTESIAIAAVAEDGFPDGDGIGDDLTGFLRTEIDLELRQGHFVAVSRHDRRPEPVDASRVAAIDRNDGTAEVRGEPGAAIPFVAVEVLRFNVDRADPAFTVTQAAQDGGFSVVVTAVAGDLILVRNAPGGRRSDARVVTVE